MLNNLLLPNKYRKLGFILFIPAIILLNAVYMYEYSIPFMSYEDPTKTGNFLDFNNHDFSDELALLITFFSLFCIAFSKEKKEDEYLQGIRLRALQISVYLNYLVLVLATILIYGGGYMYVLFGNLFTILIIFIIVYYYQVHIKGRLSKEEQS